jgi:hypothetical protein
MTVAKKISKYKLDLMREREVRWEGGGTEPAGEHTFVYRKGDEHQELDTGFLVHKKIISTLKRAEFVNARMSYIKLRGRWCDIIILNVHAPTEYKIDGMKASFQDELEYVFNIFPKYHTKSLLGDFNTKLVREDTFKPTILNEIYTKFIMIMELEQ